MEYLVRSFGLGIYSIELVPMLNESVPLAQLHLAAENSGLVIMASVLDDNMPGRAFIVSMYGKEPVEQEITQLEEVLPTLSILSQIDSDQSRILADRLHALREYIK